jgi:hypothetical protein
MRRRPLPGTFGACTQVGHTALFGRDISLWRRNGTRRFHAEITNGSPGDTVWVEIEYSAVATPLRGPSAAIPSRQRSVSTIERDYSDNRVRACGKAVDRSPISCTSWH